MSNKRFIKTMYINKKESNTGKEKVVFIAKNENGEKISKVIPEPNMHYYKTKKEFWLDDNEYVKSIEMDKVERVDCKHKDIISSIVNEVGTNVTKSEYSNILKSGDYQSFRKLKDFHLMSNVHGSDINIEDYIINEFIKQYPDHEIPISKCFFDIEVDGTQVEGFPDAEKAEAEINIIAVTNWDKMETVVFALQYDTDTYRETMDNQEKLINDLNSIYNNKEGELGLDLGMKFILMEMNTEMEVIRAFLHYINEISKPDVCTAWNLDFDFPTIYNRILKNNEDPALYFSSSDFEDKIAKYRLDTGANDAANRSSTFECNSYTNWIDQLALYANIQKPNGALESLKLNDIGEKEAKISKDVYEGSIKDLHYRDYYTFILYNIKDTILAALIEANTNMFDLLFSVVDRTRTRPIKALKKTICLRNYNSAFLEKQGYVISNNRSKLLADPNADKIRGGFVADMSLTENNGELLMKSKNYRSNRLYRNVSDFDLRSLYPSVIDAFNITNEGFVGTIKLLDIDKIKMPKNIKDPDTFDPNTEFVSKFISQNLILLAQDFAGLKKLNDASDEILENL